MEKSSLWTGCLLLALLLSSGFVSAKSGDKDGNMFPEYTVAAYIWPSCHDDPMGREVLWPDGTGEWEIIKKGNPRFPGHYQPKVPLWGYELDNDPKVMERWIDLATDHGVNTFIFDWYWFNNGPFLESCLNDGFLKAPNNRKMNFYIMWADHDVARIIGMCIGIRMTIPGYGTGLLIGLTSRLWYSGDRAIFQTT